MKYSLAASFAMAALVGAAPLNNKRDIVYSTTTVEEWVTEWYTTTVWEGEAPTAAASPTPVGGFYEVKSSAVPTSGAAPIVKPGSASSPSTPAVPVVASNSNSSTSIAAPSTSSTPVYVAPTTPSSPYVAPTPTYVAPVVELPTTTAAPVVPTSTTPAYVAPAATTSKASTSVSAATSSGGYGTSTGDMTYYDVSVGLTSCGLTGSNSDFLVAMNKPDMANGANPNNNPHCNQYINIYYNGVGPIKGKVVDTCPECVSGAIDVTDSLFKAIAPSGDGRVHGVSWSWA